MISPDDALQTGKRALIALATRSSQEQLALTCIPPPPAPSVPYGNVVPLGLALRALSLDPCADAMKTSADLRLLLDQMRRGLLWPFQSGGLVTATDSGLVLLGYRDPHAVEALESFADGDKGYVPQLYSSDPIENHMPVSDFNRHWRQPDYGTTCLVLALRRETGLPLDSRLRRVLQRILGQRLSCGALSPPLPKCFSPGSRTRPTGSGWPLTERTQGLWDALVSGCLAEQVGRHRPGRAGPVACGQRLGAGGRHGTRRAVFRGLRVAGQAAGRHGLMTTLAQAVADLIAAPDRSSTLDRDHAGRYWATDRVTARQKPSSGRRRER